MRLPHDDIVQRASAGDLTHEQTHRLLTETFGELVAVPLADADAREVHDAVCRVHRARHPGCTYRWWEVVS